MTAAALCVRLAFCCAVLLGWAWLVAACWDAACMALPR